METIILDGEDGSQLELGVLAQTRVKGSDNMLTVDPEEFGVEVSADYILIDTSEDGDKDGCYVFVEDDTEFDAVYKVFEVMLDEIDFE